jgi:hypothetical protein
VVRIRAFEERDRAGALDLVDGRAFDGAHQHLHVAEGGGIVGVSLWKELGRSRDGHLVMVSVRAGVERATYWRLARACCADALAHGMERGFFIMRNGGLVALIERTYRVTVEEWGWEPGGGAAVEWRIMVDLEDALAQLDKVLG